MAWYAALWSIMTITLAVKGAACCVLLLQQRPYADNKSDNNRTALLAVAPRKTGHGNATLRSGNGNGTAGPGRRADGAADSEAAHHARAFAHVGRTAVEAAALQWDIGRREESGTRSGDPQRAEELGSGSDAGMIKGRRRR